MIVWFEQGSSEDTEYTGHMQMRSTETRYEIYDMMNNLPFPKNGIGETIFLSYL